jgi:hypothetical protein
MLICKVCKTQLCFIFLLNAATVPSWSWALYDRPVETNFSKELTSKLNITYSFVSKLSSVEYCQGLPSSLCLSAQLEQCMCVSDPVSCVSDQYSFRWYLVSILAAVSRERRCCTDHVYRHFRLVDKEERKVRMMEFDCLDDAERASGEIFTSVVLGYRMNWRYPKTSWLLLVTKRVDDRAYVRPNYRRQ